MGSLDSTYALVDNTGHQLERLLLEQHAGSATVNGLGYRTTNAAIEAREREIDDILRQGDDEMGRDTTIGDAIDDGDPDED